MPGKIHVDFWHTRREDADPAFAMEFGRVEDIAQWVRNQRGLDPYNENLPGVTPLSDPETAISHLNMYCQWRGYVWACDNLAASQEPANRDAVD